MSLKRLRIIAELNLCENCYKNYKAMLEPTIKKWLLNPLTEWANVESNITQMVMKLKGVFKTDVIFLTLDDNSDEKYDDEVDVKTFQEIKRHWGFKRKIKYLRDEGVLGDSSYSLLFRLSNIRNKIHEEFSEFSEQDLNLFRRAHTITYQIHHATMFKPPEGISERLKPTAEKSAEQMLSKFNDV